MKIDSCTRGDLVLKELGRRIAQKRVRRNVSQEAFAQQSGISRSSLQRLEKGDGGTKLATFLSALRSLGVSEALDLVLPEEEASPIEVFDSLIKARARKRASCASRKVGGIRMWGDGTPMSGGAQ